MRRERVFPSIEWVIARSQPRPIVNFTRLPPDPIFSIPQTPRSPYRRYEPYMWAYALPAHMRRQRRRLSESIAIQRAGADGDSLVEVKVSIKSSAADTLSTSTTKSEFELTGETPVVVEEHKRMSPHGIWILIKYFLAFLMMHLRRVFVTSPPSQPTSPC